MGMKALCTMLPRRGEMYDVIRKIGNMYDDTKERGATMYGNEGAM